MKLPGQYGVDRTRRKKTSHPVFLKFLGKNPFQHLDGRFRRGRIET